MARITLLDGGMGQELVARSAYPPSPLWSAEIMEREAGLVKAVHRDFIRAGASVITLNAYMATPERLGQHMDPVAAGDRFVALQAQSIGIAQAARAECRSLTGGRVAIAGCLPPLVASYHPDASPSFEDCLASFARIVAIQKPACEVILAETMSSVLEARAATRACIRAGCRGWIALSVDDADGTRLRSGEPLAEGVDAVREEGALAILLNCSRPEAITRGLDLLATSGVPFGAYANGFVDAAELQVGTTVEGMAVRTDLGPEAYADHAMDWIARGATIVGGCCEVGPGHIAHLHDRIRAAGHAIETPQAAPFAGGGKLSAPVGQ